MSPAYSRPAAWSAPPETFRSQHLSHHLRPTRDRRQTRAGADQHQPAAPAAVLNGELLGQRTTPGEAQDVDPLVTQLISNTAAAGSAPENHRARPGPDNHR